MTMVGDEAMAGLERLCGAPRRDWMRLGRSAPGIERIEACFAGHAFDPHRHDTYALGITTGGAQGFRYRGAERCSLRGQAIVLHPDEPHDGHAAAEGGFRYRMLYIAPALIARALGDDGRPLPFVTRAVTDDARLRRALAAALADIDEPLDDLAAASLATDVADALDAADRSRPVARRGAVDGAALARASAMIDADPAGSVAAETLERVTGLSRFALARQFRGRYGTSPHRYRTMRRLDRTREAILAGSGLAEAAADAGFADQSHMSRHFKRAYGVTPGRWAAMTRAAAP